MITGVRDQLELSAEVGQLYDDPRLTPLLRRLLTRSRTLIDAVAASISFVESSAERYTKVAEIGAACQLGSSFHLDQGVTGQVVQLRRPVVLRSYRDVRSGHLDADSPAAKGSVAAVPIWWRGDVIGVNVVFAGRQHAFAAAEVDALEILTQLAAPGIVQAGSTDPLLSRLLQDRPPTGPAAAVSLSITEVGDARPVPGVIAELALGLVSLAEHAAARGNTPASLHVALVHREDGLRLLVQDEHGADPARPAWSEILPAGQLLHWQDVVGETGGAVHVEDVPGWGTLLKADLPYRRQPIDPVEPFTQRERQVLEMLGKGMTDRAMAGVLVLSPRTVEKYVGAVLRKTGATSRTAAVLTALDRGWLPTSDSNADR